MQKHSKYSNKTNHLSSKEIENLKLEYYSGGNTKELILKYNIDITPSNLVYTFPLIKTKNEQCKYCKVTMYFISPAKTNKNRKEYVCINCNHKESILRCTCKQCLYQKAIDKEDTRKKKSITTKKNKEIVVGIREYPNAPLLRMLNIKERLYLGALLRVHIYHDCLLIDMSSHSEQNYAPTSEYQHFILMELLDRNIITPYKIRKNEDSKILEKYVQGELYDICINDINLSKRELVTELMYPDSSNSLSYAYQDIFMIKNEIQINEAIEYMMLIVKKFDFYSFNVEEKYRILFTRILNDYSLGQLFNFIYTAVRNQAAYSKRKCHQGYVPIPNYIYKSILDRYDKAQMHEWNIIRFNRIAKAPKTELSKLLDIVLQR